MASNLSVSTNHQCIMIHIVSKPVWTEERRKEERNKGHIKKKLWLYGVTHMVKNHSDNEKGNMLLPHGLLFPISSKGSFISIIPQTRYTGWNEK